MFEIFNKSMRGDRTNMAVVGTNGQIQIPLVHAQSVGIDGRAMLMVDRDAVKLAVKAQVPGDGSYYKVAFNGRRHVRVAGMAALKAMGINPMRARGRYPVAVEDGMVVVNLADAKRKSQPAAVATQPAE